MKEVVIVDYGMGNIKSVKRGLEKVGATVKVSSDPETIVAASKLVLPGVGSFKDGMRGLESSNLNTAICDYVKTGNLLLGICLGMQMLLDYSEENGYSKGLGLIPGSVKAIPMHDNDQFVRKVPHIGWSRLESLSGKSGWDGTYLNDVKFREYLYFVHSFMAIPKDQSNILAYCEYEKLLIVAAIRHNNVTGLQFHPEKSGKSGLRVLYNFVNT